MVNLCCSHFSRSDKCVLTNSMVSQDKGDFKNYFTKYSPYEIVIHVAQNSKENYPIVNLQSTAQPAQFEPVYT